MPIVSTGQFTITDVNDSPSAVLSNESAVVPANPDGSSPVLTGCITTLSVNLGGVDDSLNWTVSAAPSSGVTGTLATRTYTVTGFTVDAGWVDLTATRVGWPSLTKRFNLSKTKQGVTGATGAQGPAVVVTPDRATTFTSTDGTLDGSQADIVFTAAVSGVTSPTYAWTFSGLQTNPTASTTATQTVTAAQFGTSKAAIVTCTVSGAYTDKVTIVRLERSTAAAGANQTSIDANGSIQGVSSGAGTAVNNAVAVGDMLNSGGGLLPNWNLRLVDAAGKPAGIQAVEGITNRSGVAFGDASCTWVKIHHATDTTVAYGFPAIPIDDRRVYVFRVRHKSTSASPPATGLYYYFIEKAGTLATGKTHVMRPAGDATVGDLNTTVKYVYNNYAYPNNSGWVETADLVYVPTIGTRFATFAAANWGFATTVELHIDAVYLTSLSSTVYRQTSQPSGGIYVKGDTWVDTDAIGTPAYQYDGASWQVMSNYTTNTNQLTDGAGLGTTATWAGVTGSGKPQDNATNNVVGNGLLSARPAGTDGDFYYATDTGAMYQKVSGAWVLSSTNTSIDANGNIQGVSGGAGQSVANNVDNVIRSPGGGVFVTTTATLTGALKIKLPQLWSSTMVRFTVEIFEYLAGYSCTLEVGGYSYNAGGGNGSWINCTARVIGGSNVEYPVRFGRDADKCCVWIGNHTETWSYPQVRVRDVFLGYGSATAAMWSTGWAISFDTTSLVSGVQPLAANQFNVQILDTLPGADWTKTAKRPANLASLTGTEGILNSGVSLTATGALSGAGGGQIVTIPVFDRDRTIDRPPNWYPVGTTREFKAAATFPGVSGGTYLTLETIIQYGDGSGGAAYQYAYCGTTTWRRTGVCGAASWSGAWVQDLDRAAYTGDLNATNGAPAGTMVNGVLAQTLTAQADSATALLADIASDNRLTPAEKLQAQGELAILTAERQGLLERAAVLGVATSEYTVAYDQLVSYTTPLFASMLSTDTIIGTEFRAKFQAVYTARSALLNLLIAEAGVSIAISASAAGFQFLDGVASPPEQHIAFTGERHGTEAPITFVASDEVPLLSDSGMLLGIGAAVGLPTTGDGSVAYLSLSDFAGRERLVVTALCAGRAASTVVSRLDRSTAEAGATVGAPAGTTVGGTPAETVAANANAAYAAVNDPATGLNSKLKANADNVLGGVLVADVTTAPVGMRVGSVTWNAAGDVTGGSGVAITPKGVYARNPSKTTFVLDAVTGDATFSGNLTGANITGATGTFSGSLTAETLGSLAQPPVTITTTGNVTVPAGMNSVRYELVGGGGGGGGGATAFVAGYGGGGGSGAYMSGTLAVTAGATLAITIGTGGAGGANTLAGGNGTASSIGALVTAAGGTGGGGSAGAGFGVGGATPTSVPTAASKAGATAARVYDGLNTTHDGYGSFNGEAKYDGAGFPKFGVTGAGGANPLGTGGASVNTGVGSAGAGYGAGGAGGGGSLSTNVTATGGAGRPGMCRLTFLNSNGVVLQSQFENLKQVLASQGIAVA